MSSLDILKNKYELLVKTKTLAKAPPVHIAILAILDVFQLDFMFDELLSGHL